MKHCGTAIKNLLIEICKKINLAKRPARVNVRGAWLSDTGVLILNAEVVYCRHADLDSRVRAEQVRCELDDDGIIIVGID